VNIRDLAATTGISERQVRYLISEGFMPPPTGGRARAQYDDAHVAAIRRYGRLKDLGFPPAAIRKLLQARQGVPFPIGPGITLVVDPALIGAPADTRSLLAEAERTLASIFSGDPS
jgi:MerR family copper efflux transcriptional regulator